MGRGYRGGFYRDFYSDFYPKSRPIAAKGGIKAQAKRGSFGQSWWAKRWIAVLESFNIGGRLGRGRSYARNGQVLSIDVGSGVVKAEVQGSRPTPYKVTIKVRTLAAEDWQRLTHSLSRQAIYVAKLLAGEMPQDIEEAVKEVKLSLFPEKLGDLKTECSCPDYSNPCKHIAAVYYLLGEEFDRDPFLIFKLRGITREQLVAQLGQSGSQDVVTPAKKRRAGVKAPPPAEVETVPSLDPIPAELARFWDMDELPVDFFGEVQIPRMAAALPRRLGNFPFWRGEANFLETLEGTYAQADFFRIAEKIEQERGESRE